MTTVKGACVSVPISKLFLVDSPRSRAVDSSHVELLAQLEEVLPPIAVHRESMRVVDGVHRLEAAKARGATEISVVFFEGTLEDAFAHAVEKNVRHGLPLTLKERTDAAARIMASHADWSDRRVAATAGLSRKAVAAIRRVSADDQAGEAVRTGRDGRARPVSSAAGREHAARVLRENPGASLREVARVAGISPSTVRDVRNRTANGEDPVPVRQRPPDRRPTVPGPAAPGTVRLGVAGEQLMADCSRRYANLLHVLKSDPSVRLTESGRLVLRLLETRVILIGERDRLLQAIPQHCVPNLSAAVRQCAEAWDEFAQHLETFEAAEERGAG
ncbi:ParB N-terminal domain-containing protein [Streptomyces sp. NPDC085942]|uniref:ParB/RepB/Spo0J family partition protein n=1 Tax=Streptomyces sp. NPDC085942 TaxID=3365743 RepID=UPI0037D5D1F6